MKKIILQSIPYLLIFCAFTLPRLGSRPLDWLVVATSGNEQMAALAEVIERYLPARHLQEQLSRLKVEPVITHPGQLLELG